MYYFSLAVFKFFFTCGFYQFDNDAGMYMHFEFVMYLIQFGIIYFFYTNLLSFRCSDAMDVGYFDIHSQISKAQF